MTMAGWNQEESEASVDTVDRRVGCWESARVCSGQRSGSTSGSRTIRNHARSCDECVPDVARHLSPAMTAHHCRLRTPANQWSGPAWWQMAVALVALAAADRLLLLVLQLLLLLLLPLLVLVFTLYCSHRLLDLLAASLSQQSSHCYTDTAEGWIIIHLLMSTGPMDNHDNHNDCSELLVFLLVCDGWIGILL